MNQGAADYNLDLSTRRAKAVAADLAANHGIAQDRLTSEGKGFTQPVASNSDEDGRGQPPRRTDPPLITTG